MDVPTPILAALIGLVGSIFLVPLATRLINNMLDRRAKLIARISILNAKTNPIIEHLFEERPRSTDFTERLADARLTAKLISREAYIRIALENQSSRKISNLTLRLENSADYFAQVDGANVVDVDGKIPFSIGDLQPKREVIIQLWRSLLFTMSKSDFKFSADELHAVRIHFPMPEHIERERRSRMNSILGWIAAAFFLAGLLGPVLVGRLRGKYGG